MPKLTPREIRRGKDAELIRAGRRLLFTGQCERDGELWFVSVPEVYSATQAERFEDLELMVRGLVAIVLDVEPDAFDVRLEPAP